MNSIQTIFNQRGNIIYLLPYSNNFKLTNRQQKRNELLLIKCIIEISIIALKSFLEGNLIDFDAQVGENLCQIRAYKNICLAYSWLHNDENKEKLFRLTGTLHEYKSNIDSVIKAWEKSITESKQYNKILDGTETIEAFLNRHNITLELCEDTIYLISCYFLTHFAIRDDGVPMAINFKEISSTIDVSKHRAERLIHRYQLIVAKLGCDFIIKIASDLPLAESYSKLLPELYQLSDVDRYALPCHIVSEIILEHCMKNNMPILFLFNRVKLTHPETIYFVFKGPRQIDLTHLDNNDYCLVISGVNFTTQPTSQNYLNYLNYLNLMELVLANTATHPQYSGNKLRTHCYNPFFSVFKSNNDEAVFFGKRLQYLKELAYRLGCHKEKPYEFFLKHIYANKLILEKIKLRSKRGLVTSGSSILTGKHPEGTWKETMVSI